MIGDTTLTTHRMKYSAAYSTGREFGKKCYCVTLTVSEGSDPLKSRGGIAAEMNVRQAYTVKHIRKDLTLLNHD